MSIDGYFEILFISLLCLHLEIVCSVKWKRKKKMTRKKKKEKKSRVNPYKPHSRYWK